MRTSEEIIRHPELLPQLIESLNAKRPEEKYGAAKALIALSEQAPGILYPEFDFFAGLLDGKNNVLRWNAIRILANLACVDSENRLERIFDIYFKPVRGPIMITAGHVIMGAAVIAAAKPELASRITAEILKVERARYATPECRRIAIGHAITAFELFFNDIDDKEPVLNLVRKQLRSTRLAVRRKAERFLAKHAAAAEFSGSEQLQR